MEPDSNGTDSDCSPSSGSHVSRSTRSRSRNSRSRSGERNLYPELDQELSNGADLPDHMERFRKTQRRQVDVGEDEVVISGEMRMRSRRHRFDQEESEKERRPMKSFEQFVKEDDEKEKMGLKRQKTMDDYELKSSKKGHEETQRWSPMLFKLAEIGFVLTAVFFAGWVLYHNLPILEFEEDFRAKDYSYNDARNSLLIAVRSKMGPNKELFPRQTENNIIKMYTTISSTLEDSTPRQPSCIALVSPSTMSNSFPLCFAQKFALLGNSLYAMVQKGEDVEPFLIDLPYLARNDISSVRLELDEYFRKGKTVIVKDAENFKDENHLRLLHGLCDNTGAIDKRAAIIFLLPYDEKMCAVKGACDTPAQLVYNVLDHAWKTAVGDDSRPAMIARVAASEVVLLNEDDCS